MRKQIWHDENVVNPSESGIYICKVRVYDNTKYVRCFVEFDIKTGWFATDSIEHIFWLKKI